MTDQSSDSVLEFPINQTLLEEATARREEWLIVRARLEKIEKSKPDVTPVVYNRVRKDYDAKLAEATAELMRKKEAVDHEIATLRETRAKISAQLEDKKNKLEEIKFRNTLGEFSEEEYQAAAKTEQDKITKFETVLAAVDNNVSRYESIFAEHADIFPSAKKRVEGSATDIRVHEAKAHEEEEEGIDVCVSEDEDIGPDYFSPVSEPQETNADIEESATVKELPKSEISSRDAKHRARVVIISGSEAGAAYPIEGVLSFGRADSNTVVLKDAKVSRQHAQIQQQGGEFVVVDLNSSNGTFVNKQRVEEHVLANGDEIQIGDYVMQFQV